MISKLTILFMAMFMVGSANIPEPHLRKAQTTTATVGNAPALVTVCAGPMALEILPREDGLILVSFGKATCDDVTVISVHLDLTSNNGRRVLPVRTR